MTETTYEHIVLDERGVPYIEGTTVKVIEVVLDKIAYDWSPEKIHEEHPHLSLGQICSAFAYYYDHRDELDRDIKQRFEKVEELRKKMGPSPLVQKLKEKGLR